MFYICYFGNEWPKHRYFLWFQNGINRSFLESIFPSNISDTKDRPVVINMHGYGSNALEQEIYTQMDPVADKEGFIVIYPDGINSSMECRLVIRKHSR